MAQTLSFRAGSSRTVDTARVDGGVFRSDLAGALSDIAQNAGALQSQPVTPSAPTTGQTVVMSTTQSLNIVNPAGTLASLTVTMPTNPVDGQVCQILFTQTITSLTLTGCTPAITTVAAGTTLTFRRNATAATWFRG